MQALVSYLPICQASNMGLNCRANTQNKGTHRNYMYSGRHEMIQSAFPNTRRIQFGLTLLIISNINHLWQ